MTTCPSCAVACPEGSRFCGQCGARLAPPTEAAEHRPITALFCDLVGFTSLCERADPEDVDRLLHEYYTAARGVIEHFGGIVEKFVGDAVLGIFGVPTTHEDHAERAVRAGLSLLDKMRGLSPVAGVTAEIRIGINSGIAIVRPTVDPSSGEALLSGDAINTAARLQQAATPMQVVVGEETHVLTAHAIEYEAGSPRRVKGKRRPVATWVARRPVASVGIDLRRTFSTPLVGREVELGILTGLFDSAVATLSPRFVLLVGEAGQGKSRLVHELARSLDERPGLTCTWRQGHCPAYAQEGAYHALGQIVRQHAGILESDDGKTVERKLEWAVRNESHGVWICERLRPLVGLDASPVSREESFAAWETFVATLAGVRPAVVVFEDLHWASTGSLAFFDHLVRGTRGVPLVVVFTARPEIDDVAPGLVHQFPSASPSTARTLRLDVGSLAEQETERLVAALAGEALADETRSSAIGLCAGNPLYAEELVRWLKEAERRGPVDGHADELTPAPTSLRSLISARLDALKPAHKSLLADAAVVGGVFWPGALTMMGKLNEPEVTEGLAALARRELIRRHHDSSIADQDEFVFWHALTHDVAYERLTRATRARKHAEVARWVETQGLQRAGSGLQLLVHHYLASLTLAQKTGDERLVAEVRQPTVTALALAADRALPLDFALSERYARRAIELVQTEDAQLPSLLVRWGAALQRCGQQTIATDALEMGTIALLASGDTVAAGRGLIRLASAQLQTNGGQALQSVTKALDLLDSDPPSPELVSALEMSASIHLLGDDAVEAMAAADRAIAIAAELDLPEPLRALECKTLATHAEGAATDSLAACDRILASIRSGRIDERTAQFFITAGSLMSLHQGIRPALAVFREGRRHAQEHHDHVADLHLRTGEVESQFLLGEWAVAGPALEELARELLESGIRGSGRDVTDIRTLLLALQGDMDQLQAATHTVDDTAVRGSDSLHLLSAALACRTLGDDVRARDLLERLPGDAGLVSTPTMSLYWPCAIRLALDLEDPDLALRLAVVLLDSKAVPGVSKNAAAALQSAVAAEPSVALGLFRTTAERWRRHAVPFEAAHAFVGQASCLLELERASDAAAALGAAIEIFERLGARPALTAARSLRQRAL